jgi:hypothetical protein
MATSQNIVSVQCKKYCTNSKNVKTSYSTNQTTVDNNVTRDQKLLCFSDILKFLLQNE